MYQAILTARENPVITPVQLASFGRFDVPTAVKITGSQSYQLSDTAIEAATDQVETMAAQACL